MCSPYRAAAAEDDNDEEEEDEDEADQTASDVVRHLLSIPDLPPSLRPPPPGGWGVDPDTEWG